jgi:hypothetical protein
MYLSTYSGLGQAPRLHGSFAENTGVSSPLSKKFLDQVRKRPQDFKKLLLTVTFHPAPVDSKIANRNQPPFVDMILMDGIQPVALLNPLRRIRDELQKRDSRYKQQIEAELQLRNEMIKITGALGPQKLRPFLVETLFPATGEFPETDTWKLCRLARNFAQMRLPQELAQRIMNSEASESHLTNLGRFLRRYAEVLQTKDPFFKSLVVEERKSRLLKQEQEKKQQLEQERKKKPPRRRRP